MKPIDVVITVQSILTANKSKWEKKYSKYLKGTIKHKLENADRRSKFHKWGGLSVYSSIDKA